MAEHTPLLSEKLISCLALTLGRVLNYKCNDLSWNLIYTANRGNARHMKCTTYVCRLTPSRQNICLTFLHQQALFDFLQPHLVVKLHHAIDLF